MDEVKRPQFAEAVRSHPDWTTTTAATSGFGLGPHLSAMYYLDAEGEVQAVAIYYRGGHVTYRLKIN